ncbi:MAG: hypothetical protein AB2693_27745, partial [Candidatus Thiodiazotropha sp.]
QASGQLLIFFTGKHKAHLSDTTSISNKTAYTNICKTAQSRRRDIDPWLEANLSKSSPMLKERL